MNKGQKCVMLTDDLQKRIINLYHDGERLEDIANEVGMPLSTLKKRVTAWKKDGTLPQERLRANEKRKKPEYKKPRSEWKPRDYSYLSTRRARVFVPGESYIPNNEEPIKCTKTVAKTCAFGAGECVNYKCDFYTITKQRRGCPHAACTHYLKKSKEHPQYVSSYSFAGSQENLFVRKESKDGIDINNRR